MPSINCTTVAIILYAVAAKDSQREGGGFSIKWSRLQHTARYTELSQEQCERAAGGCLPRAVQAVAFFVCRLSGITRRIIPRASSFAVPSIADTAFFVAR